MLAHSRISTPRHLAALGLWLGSVVLLGCGRDLPLGKVEGAITLDGRPLAGVLITFVPEDTLAQANVRSMGISDETGAFTLRAESQQEGALIGAHRVIVEDLAIYHAPRSEDGTVIAMPPARFPNVYADVLRSPLRAIVREADQHIALELTSRP